MFELFSCIEDLHDNIAVAGVLVDLNLKLLSIPVCFKVLEYIRFNLLDLGINLLLEVGQKLRKNFSVF